MGFVEEQYKEVLFYAILLMTKARFCQLLLLSLYFKVIFFKVTTDRGILGDESNIKQT